MAWFDLPKRLLTEKLALESFIKKVEFEQLPDRETKTTELWVRNIPLTSQYGRTHVLWLRYPERYPHERPHMYYPPGRGRWLPHCGTWILDQNEEVVEVRLNGSLCFWNELRDGRPKWDPNRDTAKRVIQKAQLWIDAYDYWEKMGTWPGDAHVPEWETRARAKIQAGDTSIRITAPSQDEWD